MFLKDFTDALNAAATQIEHQAQVSAEQAAGQAIGQATTQLDRSIQQAADQAAMQAVNSVNSASGSLFTPTAAADTADIASDGS